MGRSVTGIEARRAVGVPAVVRFHDLRHQEISRFVARMAKADEFALREIQERALEAGADNAAPITRERHAN